MYWTAARSRSITATLSLCIVTACGGEGSSGTTEPTVSVSPVAQYVQSVRAVAGTATIAARLDTGSAPAAVGGATITAQRVGVLLPGGSSQVRFESRARFNRAIVAIDGIKGYYEVTLPTPDSVVVLIVTTTQQPPQSALQLRYAAGSGANVSNYTTENVTLTRVGTGAIQANVQWSTATDVDLSLVEPGGRVISFSSPVSAAGAQLDLDSNARCALDNRNNENITYAAGRTPPSGQYSLRVNYWSACDVTAATPYVVTLTVRGVTQTFTGVLTGSGSPGGSGVEVARFSF
jgi:hypothetical protein